MKRIKLSAIAKENLTEDIGNENKLTKEDIQRLHASLKEFSKYGSSIYRENDIRSTIQEFSEIAEMVSKHMVSEQDEWFDKLTLNRHAKQLKDSCGALGKAAKESFNAQHRLEAVFEDASEIIKRYYDVG